ncbi:uncharacterized protein [Choristoneura fumiferana]|uniref:uncharacterized protein n=1 Tax=Choristoneura fumiferana TaxID=7141 RepID=UPI003D158D91
MWIAQCCFLLLNFIGLSTGLLCYNCSSTNRDWNHCSGDFGTASPFAFNSSRLFLINCTGDNAMCFVRSWSARAKHAWLVQRGCYQAGKEDPLPRGLLTPTRAMACKRERLSDAEYKVCLCQADWCNSAKSHFPHRTLQFMKTLISITFIFIPYLYALGH